MATFCGDGAEGNAVVDFPLPSPLWDFTCGLRHEHALYTSHVFVPYGQSWPGLSCFVAGVGFAVLRTGAA